MPEDLTIIERRLEDHDARLKAVEDWRSDITTTDAVRAERDKHLDKRFDRLEASVDEVKGYLLKIVWVIVLGIVGALITFITTGGLVVGG